MMDQVSPACAAAADRIAAEAKSGSDRPLVLDAYSPAHNGSTPGVSSRSTLARNRLYVATVRGSISLY